MNTKPKHHSKIVALDNLSLGISIVAAILIGIGLGLFLWRVTGIFFLLWVGVVIGIGAAILNIYKAYKRAQKEFKELENDPRYTFRAKYGDNKYADDDE